MQVLEVGQTVFQMRFLSDGRRLVVGSMAPDLKVRFDVLSLDGGEGVQLNVPRADIDSWWYHAFYGNAIAPDPSGEVCYISWASRLYAFRVADGKLLPVPAEVRANQVAVSPDGKLVLSAYRTREHGKIWAVQPGPKRGSVLWRSPSLQRFAQLAGILPDGERFVTVDGVVRIRSSATGEELAAARLNPVGAQHPQVSPDGRYLGLIGYHSMYFWDLATLKKPQRISGSSSFGNFRSFAFHPNGKTVAVIHGGPTLVKVYDLATLKLIHKWNWKVGALRSVAYSPDGTLGAAGSEDGRIVVWDVDE